MSTRSVSSPARGALVLATLLAAMTLERRRPLRRMREPAAPHDRRNLALAALGALSIALVEGPVVRPLVRAGERRRWGLLRVREVPGPLETAAAVLLLDYTQYLWHLLTHRVPLLWRFHEAHHVDQDLTATTGVRFHPGELLLAIPFRALQVVVLGVSPRALDLWQWLTTVQILVHHANVRLPLRLERALCTVLVTPRMHGIHHSIVRAETDANWGTLLSVFDRLHGTLRLNVPSRAVTTGVPAYARVADRTLVSALALPFRRDLRSWTRPGQPAPGRDALALPPHRLAD